MARRTRPTRPPVARQVRTKYRPQMGNIPVNDDPHGPMEGEAIIRRLNSYLLKVEGLIQTMDIDDPRSMLLALDQARKTCESLGKLYLDVMRAQLDVEVQIEFRRIVMAAINSTAPDVAKRIISEIRARAASHGVLGVHEKT